MTVLGILWFILIAVLIAGYFILDGFDLGSGVLSPFVAKDEKEKPSSVAALVQFGTVTKFGCLPQVVPCSQHLHQLTPLPSLAFI